MPSQVPSDIIVEVRVSFAHMVARIRGVGERNVVGLPRTLVAIWVWRETACLLRPRRQWAASIADIVPNRDQSYTCGLFGMYAPIA